MGFVSTTRLHEGYVRKRYMDAKAITVASLFLLYPHNQYIDKQQAARSGNFTVMVISLSVPHPAKKLADKNFVLLPLLYCVKGDRFCRNNIY